MPNNRDNDLDYNLDYGFCVDKSIYEFTNFVHRQVFHSGELIGHNLKSHKGKSTVSTKCSSGKINIKS